MNKHVQRSPDRRRGFSLIEAVIAMGILAIVSLALYRGTLIAREQSMNAARQVAATNYVNAMLEQLVAGLTDFTSSGTGETDYARIFRYINAADGTVLDFNVTMPYFDNSSQNLSRHFDDAEGEGTISLRKGVWQTGSELDVLRVPILAPSEDTSGGIADEASDGEVKEMRINILPEIREITVDGSSIFEIRLQYVYELSGADDPDSSRIRWSRRDRADNANVLTTMISVDPPQS